MDELLLLVSRAALLVVGVGGSIAIVAVRVRRRAHGREWVPAIAACAVLLMFANAALPAIGVPERTIVAIQSVWFLVYPTLAATFPNGRFVPRWSIALIAVSAAVVAIDWMLGRAWNESEWWVVFAATQAFLGVVCLVYRYRRSADTAERESLRWLLIGLLVTIAAFAAIQVADGSIGEGSPLAAAKADFAGVPLALGLTVGSVAPRAWNVDAAFRMVLTLLGAGWLLFGIFAAARALASSMGADPEAAATWGASAVALGAYPSIVGSFRAANWLVYRDRLAPDAAVARLAAELDADDARPVAQRIVDLAAASTASAAVRLVAASREDGAVFDAATSTAPSTAGPAEERTPVVLRGELLATLWVAPRRGESELSPRDRATADRLARHAAPALDGARALQGARAAQAALIGAREEERRALRRELHDDLGPTLSGLALSAAAIARTADVDAPELAASARELQRDIADVVSRAREISHGLRPAVLDDRGLEAALRERLGESDDIHLDVTGVDRLPAAVDLAALRIVQEAVANARRHASATSTTVRISRGPTGLSIDILDDGVGLPHSLTPGMGLRSIRERAAELGGRARVSSDPAGGTAVHVWLPIEAAP